jgi:hypothetical protein
MPSEKSLFLESRSPSPTGRIRRVYSEKEDSNKKMSPSLWGESCTCQMRFDTGYLQNITLRAIDDVAASCLEGYSCCMQVRGWMCSVLVHQGKARHGWLGVNPRRSKQEAAVNIVKRPSDKTPRREKKPFNPPLLEWSNIARG